MWRVGGELGIQRRQSAKRPILHHGDAAETGVKTLKSRIVVAR